MSERIIALEPTLMPTIRLKWTILLATTILSSPALADTITVSAGQSIADAAKKARAGDTIMVAPGKYQGGFKTSVDGVTFVSKVPGKAIIKGGTGDYGWNNTGENTRVEGFSIDGTGAPWRIGLAASGSDTILRGNSVSNIGKSSDCDSKGGAGILTDSYYGGRNINVVSNTVRNIGPGKCNTIHGIYIQAPDSKITGNKVDKSAGWGILGWRGVSNNDVSKNVVSRAKTGGIAFGGGDAYRGDGVARNIKIHHNRIYTAGIGVNPCGGKCGAGNVTAHNTIVKSDNAQPGIDKCGPKNRLIRKRSLREGCI